MATDNTSKIDHKQVPFGFAHCTATDCPLKATCLRALAWQALPEDEAKVLIINPVRTNAGTDCPYYSDSTPVIYAFRFKQMQSQMLPGQYAAFRNRLMARFGRNSFFVRRRGEQAMPPKEQAFIRSVLKAIGVTEELEFDRYEKRILWKD